MLSISLTSPENLWEQLAPAPRREQGNLFFYFPDASSRSAAMFLGEAFPTFLISSHGGSEMGGRGHLVIRPRPSKYPGHSCNRVKHPKEKRVQWGVWGSLRLQLLLGNAKEPPQHLSTSHPRCTHPLRNTPKNWDPPDFVAQVLIVEPLI